MAFNTNNPLGSTDPRDLSDNSENFDKLANGTASAYTDRLGNQRKSFSGMESDFAAFIAASGYEFVGNYAAGITITGYQQVVKDVSGEFWRLDGATALPYTTTGAGLPEGGAFLVVGDAAIRQELNASTTGQGSDLVAHTGTTDTVTEAIDKRTIYVGSVAELEALSLPVGAAVYLTQESRAGEGIIKSGVHVADPYNGIFIDLSNGNYWERIYSGPVKAAWFCNDDTALSTDQQAEIEAALAVTGVVDIEDLSIAVNGISATSGNFHLFSSTRKGALRVLTNTNYFTLSPISISGCQDVKLTGFELQNPEGSTTGAAQSLVRIVDSDNVSIDDLVKVLTSGGYTIYIEECNRVQVTNNKDLTRSSVWLGGSDGTRLPEIVCNDVQITGNRFEDSLYDSVKGVAKNLKINNNTFKGGNADGVDCYTSGENVIITGNYFENHAEFGIQCKTILRDSPYSSGSSDQDGYNRHVIINNNIFKDEPAYGIAVKHDDLRSAPSNEPKQYPWSYVITGNKFQNCDRATYIKAASKITVTGNDYFDCLDTAILVSNYGYELIINSNNIRATTGRGIVLSEASGTEIKDAIIGHNVISGGDAGIVCGGIFVTVDGNRVFNVTNIGIQFASSSSYILSGNSVRDSGFGYFINQFQGSVISGNTSHNNTTGFRIHADAAAKSSLAAVFGNISVNDGSNDISLADATNFEKGLNNFAI